MGPWGAQGAQALAHHGPTGDQSLGPSWAWGGPSLGPSWAHGAPKFGPIMRPGQAWAPHGPWRAQGWAHNGPWASLTHHSVANGALRTARSKYYNVASATFETFSRGRQKRLFAGKFYCLKKAYETQNCHKYKKIHRYLYMYIIMFRTARSKHYNVWTASF